MFRIIKILWLVLCIGIAGWGMLAEGDSIIFATYLIGFLTMPTGILIYIIASIVMGVFTKGNSVGMIYDHSINLINFVLPISAGYIQWFILIPKIARRMKNERSLALWGSLIFGLIAVFYGLYRFYIHVFPGSNL